jgi:lipoprotein-anchoring transpeptidase ErfK/SrfK
MRRFVTRCRFLSRLLLLLCALLLGTSCAELQTQFESRGRMLSDAIRTALAAPHPKPAFWEPDHFRGPSRIVVHLDEQRAYFYRGKHLIGASNISTGRKGYETPPGRYRVIQKDADHVSSEYGDYITRDGGIVMQNISGKDPQPPGTIFDGARMPYFLRFTGGYGMHAGFVPRYRASHGCIRMPAEMAKHFFDAAEDGTPVIVKE